MATSEKIAALIFVASVIGVYLLEMLSVSIFTFNKLKGKKSRRILGSKCALLVHLLAITGIFCFLYGYFIEPYWIEVKVITIRTEKLAEASFRLVQISDLHCDKKMRNEQRLVELINNMEPDIIVFTGDALNTLEALPRFKNTMKSLKANLAKLAVCGDFDPGHNLNLFGSTGFDLLDRKTVTLQNNGEEICVTGLCREYFSSFGELLKSVPENNFSIFLYHCTCFVEDLGNLNVDLYLCGHTHGGQVALPIYGALVTFSKYGKKYESGLYELNNTILYVNRGIGMKGGTVPRVRFLARPEITVFDIKPKRKI